MADVKITALPASSGLVATDIVVVVDDPAGVPASEKATLTQVAAVVESINAAELRTPSTHASSHATASADPIAATDIGALAQPGGTTVDGTIVTCSGTAGAAVAVSAITLSSVVTAINDNGTAAATAQSTANAALPKITATTGRVAVIGTSGTSLTEDTRLAADLMAGPASAVSGNLFSSNGTGGKTAQDSGVSAVYAADAVAPTVQTLHTTATRTLALSDLNQIIPIALAGSTSLAVTIPHTLFAAAGTGRAFVTSMRVSSLGTGAITFVGSGGIVITYHGQAPATTAIAAGDSIHVVVTSATSADVYISAVAT